MTEEDVLRKAIKKANKNGFDWFKAEELHSLGSSATDFKLMTVCLGGDQVTYWGINDVIFSHDFAKAFWGEDIRTEQYTCEMCLDRGREFPEVSSKEVFDQWHKDNAIKGHLFHPAIVNHSWNVVHRGWQYYLQQMVLREEPLRYIGEFI